MTLAPIVLFVYNRPKHTRQVLEELARNELANLSTLYIYADGPKKDASPTQIEAIQETRKVIRENQWCGQVKIQENDQNSGLSKSIIQGVTEVINLTGRVIVLEDDILTSPYFLRYMNDALELFQHRMDIGSVNGFAVDFSKNEGFPPYFLLESSDCWGWATWKSRWDAYTPNALLLKNTLIEQNKLGIFEYGGHMEILNGQINGVFDTWDVQWHAVNVLQNRKGIYANVSFVDNIGQDGSGVHYNVKTELEHKRSELNNYRITLPQFVSGQPLTHSKKIEQKYRKYYKLSFTPPLIKRVVNKLKRTIKRLIK